MPGKSISKRGTEWVIKLDDREGMSWNKCQPAISFMHLPEGGGVRPCVNMDGDATWAPIGSGVGGGVDDDDICDMEIAGPGYGEGEGPREKDFRYKVICFLCVVT